MRLFTAALMLSVFSAAPALAQDESDTAFTGPSVTLIGGIEAAQWYGDAEAAGIYGGQLGYDWQSNGIVFGVEGEVSGGTSKNCTTIFRGVGAADEGCVKPGRDLYAGGRIGTVLGETALLYAKAGYSNVHETFELRDRASGSLRSSASGTIGGYRVGIGIEKRLGQTFLLRTEYRYSNYEGDYSRHQAVIGLGLRF